MDKVRWRRDPGRGCAQYRLAQHRRRCDWRATALELCCTARRCALIALARVVPIPRRWKCKCQRMFLLSYCATGCSQPGTTSEAASTQRFLSLGAAARPSGARESRPRFRRKSGMPKDTSVHTGCTHCCHDVGHAQLQQAAPRTPSAAHPPIDVASPFNIITPAVAVDGACPDLPSTD